MSPRKRKQPKSKIGTVLSLALQAGAAFSAVRTLREARERGDKLETVDAVAHAAVIASGIALLVRGLRRARPGGEDDAGAAQPTG